MDQTLYIEDLSARLHRVEEEVSVLRKDVTELRGKQAQPTRPRLGDASAIQWADKEAIARFLGQVFADLGICAEPIGIEALQRLLARADLEHNEVTRTLIQMREE